MTIVVAAAAPDGIVLGSDSRTTTISEQGHHRIATDYARKVFAPFVGVGVATYGSAFIGPYTINGLIDQFVAERDADGSTEVDAVAMALAKFFQGQLQAWLEESGLTIPKGVRPIGFLVVGYDKGGVGRVREIRLPVPDSQEAFEKPDVDTRGRGMLWRGQTAYMRRMIEGVDWGALEKAGIEIPATIRSNLKKLHLNINTPLTLQDALDTVAFAIRTTVDMERRSDGSYLEPRGLPFCGGGLQALAVTRAGTDWLAKPRVRPSPAGLAEGEKGFL